MENAGSKKQHVGVIGIPFSKGQVDLVDVALLQFLTVMKNVRLCSDECKAGRTADCPYVAETFTL